MITISVDHPDIVEFIRVKQNLKSVRYANVSIRITDEFMRAVEADTDFTLRFDSKKVHIERKVKARQL
jgi:ribonucleoside-diphosphate reductase alpha chain